MLPVRRYIVRPWLHIGFVALLFLLLLTMFVTAEASSTASLAGDLVAALRNAESDTDAEVAFKAILEALDIPVLDPNDASAIPGLYPLEINIIVESFRAGHLTSLDQLMLEWRQEGLMCGNTPCTADIIENALRTLRRSAEFGQGNPEYLLIHIVDALGRRAKMPFDLLCEPEFKCLDTSQLFAAAIGIESVPEISTFPGLDSPFGASVAPGSGSVPGVISAPSSGYVPGAGTPSGSAPGVGNSVPYGGAIPGMGDVNPMMAQMMAAAMMQAQQEAEEEEDEDTLAMLQILSSPEGLQAMMGLMQGGGKPESTLPLISLIAPDQAAVVEQQMKQTSPPIPDIPTEALTNPYARAYVENIEELQSAATQPQAQGSGKEAAQESLRLVAVERERRYNAWQMMAVSGLEEIEAARAALEDPDADSLFDVDLSEVVGKIYARQFEDAYEEGKWQEEAVKLALEDVLESDLEQAPVGIPIPVEERASCIFLDSVQLFLVQWDLLFRSPLAVGGAL